MNKLMKIIIAIFGATNEIFSLLIPIMLALTVIVVFNMQGFNSVILMIAGILATLFRATKQLINLM